MVEVLKIFFPEKEIELEDIIIELAHHLRQVLGKNLVCVESFDGPDGENVKIVVREKTWEVVDRIMEEIWRIEVEKGIEGKILPQIVSLFEHIHSVSLIKDEKLSKQVIDELSARLRAVLKNNLVCVESFDGPDGENVKIVVREKTWEVVDRIMEEIWRIEVEKGIEGKILPSIEVSA